MKDAGMIRMGVLVTVLLATMAPAHADIDQLCLKQCVSGGQTSAGCLSNCTYGVMETPVGSSSPVLTPAQNTTHAKNHNVLSTPLPIDPHTVVTQKKPAPPIPEKDYACLTQCLHNGEAYQLCDSRCTKAPCPAGSLDCSDVAHVLNGAVVTGPAGSSAAQPTK